MDMATTFNDPFTGVPSAPPHVPNLMMLCRGEPRYCVFSIPGSLFILYMTMSAWRNETRFFRKQIPSGTQPFRLDCAHRRETYHRLFTCWLFSGGAPPLLARLHGNPDGSTSVSFSPQIRAAIYLLRLFAHRGIPMNRSFQRIHQVITSSDPIVLDEDKWERVVMATEPIETPHRADAYPTTLRPDSSLAATPILSQTPTTIIQTEPFRGHLSLAPTAPQHVPADYFIWTPITNSNLQRFARNQAKTRQRLQRQNFVDGSVAGPNHDLYLGARYEPSKSHDPCAVLETRRHLLAEAAMPSHKPGTQMPGHLAAYRRVARLTAPRTRARSRARLGHGRPRGMNPNPVRNRPRSSTLALARGSRGRTRMSSPLPTTPTATTTNQTPERLSHIPPPEPSTPEQAFAFDEAMDDYSSDEACAKELAKVEERYRHTAHAADSLQNAAFKYEYIQVMMEAEQRKCDRLRGDHLGIGSHAISGENIGFNALDWE